MEGRAGEQQKWEKCIYKYEFSHSQQTQAEIQIKTWEFSPIYRCTTIFFSLYVTLNTYIRSSKKINETLRIETFSRKNGEGFSEEARVLLGSSHLDIIMSTMRKRFLRL